MLPYSPLRSLITFYAPLFHFLICYYLPELPYAVYLPYALLANFKSYFLKFESLSLSIQGPLFHTLSRCFSTIVSIVAKVCEQLGKGMIIEWSVRRHVVATWLPKKYEKNSGTNFHRGAGGEF